MALRLPPLSQWATCAYVCGTRSISTVSSSSSGGAPAVVYLSAYPMRAPVALRTTPTACATQLQQQQMAHRRHAALRPGQHVPFTRHRRAAGTRNAHAHAHTHMHTHTPLHHTHQRRHLHVSGPVLEVTVPSSFVTVHEGRDPAREPSLAGLASSRMPHGDSSALGPTKKRELTDEEKVLLAQRCFKRSLVRARVFVLCAACASCFCHHRV